jgi:hypothetical protein
MPRTEEITEQQRDTSPRNMLDKLRTREYISIRMCDDYPDLGISENDLVIVQPTDENDENQLSCWQTYDDYFKKSTTYIIGFAGDNFGDKIFKLPCGKIRTYKKRGEAVKFFGVVVGVIKPYDATKFFKWNSEPKKESEASADEKTVICANCDNEETGSPSFFRGLGWLIKEDAAYCPACW